LKELNVCFKRLNEMKKKP